MRIPKLPKPVRIVFFCIALLIAIRTVLAIFDGVLTPAPENAIGSTVRYETGHRLSDLATSKEVKAYYDPTIGTYDLIVVPVDPTTPQYVITDVPSRTFASWFSEFPTVPIQHFPASALPPAALKATAPPSSDKQPSYFGASSVRTTVSVIDSVFSYLGEHLFQIASLCLMILLIYGMRSMGTDSKSSDQVLMPENIKGSLDENLVGMEDIKKELRTVGTMLANRTQYASHGVLGVANIMFTGPAGTGKTKAAALLAKELNAPLIHCAGSNLESGLVGGGSRKLQSIYARAQALSEQYGVCVIFLDEAQTLFMPRGATGPSSGKHSDDTANTLLNILDGVVPNTGNPVIWIVASNFSQGDGTMDDEAMLRRFPHKINFRLPNKAERQELLSHFLKKKGSVVAAKKPPLQSETLRLIKRLQTNSTSVVDEPSELIEWADLDLQQISEVTAELAPAILEDIVRSAKITAISQGSRINTRTLMAAFERTVIGLTDRETTSELIKTREIVAYHELGHFTLELQHALTGATTIDEAFDRLHTLKISTESVSRMGALGYVLSKQDEAKLQSRDRLEQLVMRLYGGVACEELKYGASSITTGSHDDIKRATNLLVTAVSQLGMYSHTKVNFLEASRLGVKVDTGPEIMALSSRLYKESLNAVEIWMPLIEELAPILLKNYVLTRDDAIAHLRQSTVFAEIAGNILNPKSSASC